jgi:hypothetical protein
MCGLIWGPIIKLSSDTVNGYNPDIAAQGDTIHISWRPNENGLKLPYVTSRDNGLSFENPVNLMPDSLGNYPVFYKDIVANDDNVYIIFIPPGSRGRPLYFIKSSNRGIMWGPPVRIENSDSTTQIWDVAMWGDSLTVIYRDFSHIETFLINSSNGGLSWFKPLSNNVGNTENKMGITSNFFYRLHKVHFPSEGYEIAMSRSSNFGDTWMDTLLLSQRDGHSGAYPLFGNGKNETNLNNLFCSWDDTKYGCTGSFSGCSIILRRNIGETQWWEDEQVLTDQPDGTNRGNISTRNNRVCTVWEKDLSNATSNIEFKYSLDYGETWSAVCTPSGNSDTLNSGGPECAVSNTAFHIVWGERKMGHYGIYYRRGTPATSVANENFSPHNSFVLEQNYPNPFNPQTAIGFSLLAVGNVTLKVYDIYGKEVATLINNKHYEAGKYSVEWNAEVYASGMYFYRMTATDKRNNVITQAKKMLLLK